MKTLMKSKKLIIIFLSSLILYSAFPQDSESKSSISQSLFEERWGLFLDASFTKPSVEKNLDDSTYGMGLSIEMLQYFTSIKVGLNFYNFNWNVKDSIYYLPAELGVNFNLPLSLGPLTLDPYIGAAGNLCLWNNAPSYGYSWNGGIRVLVYYFGVNVFYKHEYFYPIRKKDPSIDFSLTGISFTFFLDGSGF